MPNQLPNGKQNFESLAPFKNCQSGKMKTAENSIDSHISGFPAEIQQRLIAIRQLIKSIVPEATEKISYGIPTFHWKKNVVHFAGYQHHIGFYPGAEAIQFFQEKLTGWPTSKGAIQFPNDKPLPMDLIREITQHRRQVIEELR